MTDVYRIQTTLNIAGTLAPELKKILKDMQAVDRAAKGAEKALGRWVVPIDKASSSVSRLARAMAGIKLPKTAYDAEMAKWSREIQAAQSHMTGLRSTTQGVGSAARGVTRSLDSWSRRISSANDAMRRLKTTAAGLHVNLPAGGGLSAVGISARRGGRGGSGSTALQSRRRGGHGRQFAEHEGSHLAGMVGVAGGVNTLEYLVDQGAGAAREDLRAKNAGLTAVENARLRAEAIRQTEQYPSLAPLSVREQGRLLVPNVGSYDQAMKVLPEYLKGQVALQTVAGPNEGAKDMEAFARYVDVIGRSMSPEDTNKLIDGYVRARQLDAEAVRSADYVNAAKAAASPGKALNVDFWSKIAPALMSQQGGARSGTDLASAYQNTVVGRGTTESLLAQHQAGLREGFEYKTGKGGKKTVTNKGSLTDEALYNADPYSWAKKVLVPKMVSQGMLPEGYAKGDYSTDLSDEQRARGGKYISQLFSNRRGANIFSMMIQDMDQIEQFVQRLAKTRGTADVLLDQRRDPYVAGKAITTQGGRAATALSEPAMGDILTNANRISGWLGSAAETFEKFPAAAQSVFATGAAAVGGLAAGGTSSLAGAGLKFLGPGSMTFGAGTAITIAELFIPWNKIVESGKSAAGNQFPDWYKENKRSIDGKHQAASFLAQTSTPQRGWLMFEALRGLYTGAIESAVPKADLGRVQRDRARATAGMGITPENVQAATDRLGQTAGPGVQAMAAQAVDAAEGVKRAAQVVAPPMLNAAEGFNKVAGAAQAVPGALDGAAGALQSFVSRVMNSLSAAGTAAPPPKPGGAPAGPTAAPAAPGKSSFAPPPRSSAPIQVATNLQLNGRSLGRAVTQHQVASADHRTGTGTFEGFGLMTPVGQPMPVQA